MNKHWDYLGIRALPRLGILTLRRKRLGHNKLKCNDQQINKIHSNPNDQQITNPNDTYNKQITLMTKITRNQTNLTCSSHITVKQQCTQSS